MFKRKLQTEIEKYLFKGQTILIYGARQVGKTTLCKQIIESCSESKKCGYFDCEIETVRKSFETTDINLLRDAVGDRDLIVIDEAQLVENIGKTIKVLHDHFENLQIIAGCSSSFDLAPKVSEPMTGRALSFILYPLSVGEIADKIGFINLSSRLDFLLLTGSYPDIVGKTKEEAQTALLSLAGSYLYKDILMLEAVKNSGQLIKLLQALALQIGGEVSYSEIGQKIGLNHITVSKYIDLLEKCFVIFKLNSLGRNRRNEIFKSVKIYFYDLGIRNALIQTFTPLDLRYDAGALWENFCIVERKKANQAANRSANLFFHRTYNGEEVDFVEERDGGFYGYEFKIAKEHSKKPKQFLSDYKDSSLITVNKENWSAFLME